jgi:carbonic anhydrase/acetyltransferase-like protein (isoleucine patch superfamily)
MAGAPLLLFGCSELSCSTAAAMLSLLHRAKSRARASGITFHCNYLPAGGRLELHPPGARRILRREADIRPYRGVAPRIAASAYIDPAAVVIGDVVIGEDASLWPCAVARGDVNYIRIGARTNVQDGAVLHVMRDEWPLVLGEDVTVGHSVTLHGCTIESRCLIGMGAIILNGVRIGSGCIIAAGTLIPEGAAIPPGSLVMGSPGKLKRRLAESDFESISHYAKRYVEYKEIYRQERNGQ